VTRSSRLRIVALAAVVALAPVLAVLPATAGQAAPSGADDARHKPSDRAVFFTSDGLRQDLVRRYAAQGVMPTMRDLLREGVSASGNGLLTQAPPNTGAG
jgi:hypothetical protein